jgi:8-amino-3,8-dideoxy-alpha-D-manno-octulosonate transaminase
VPGFELIGKEEQNAVNEVFEKSGGVLFAHGFDARRNNIFRVRDFERSFAKRLGAAKAAACSSGTSAIYIALKALGVGPGDEVITQSFTFVATIEAILACGAIPVVVDIDDTYNIDPVAFEKALTKRTKAVIPVHMLGNPAEMSKINEIAHKHGILVVEDACEALGATYNGVSIGVLSDVAAFSLDFGKTITTGEGGMIISKNEQLVTKCFQFIDHGHENNPAYARGADTASFYGFNFRMMELQAAVGLEQIKKLDFILERNRRNKGIIKSILRQSDKINFRRITDESGELADTIIFSVQNSNIAQRLVMKLSENGIGTKNVPDAMKWHFAPHWGHIWKDSTLYSENYSTAWKKSAALLDRSVSLPIMVNWDEQFCTEYAGKIISVIDKVCNEPSSVRT